MSLTRRTFIKALIGTSVGAVTGFDVLTGHVGALSPEAFNDSTRLTWNLSHMDAGDYRLSMSKKIGGEWQRFTQVFNLPEAVNDYNLDLYLQDGEYQRVQIDRVGRTENLFHTGDLQFSVTANPSENIRGLVVFNRDIGI